MELNNLVKAAIFSALAIGLGYAFLFVPNIEFMTVIIFISGLSLGVKTGMLVGGTSMFIFSAMNPIGSGLGFPPLLIGQVLSMIIIGMIGGLLNRLFDSNNHLRFRIILAGLCGLGCALLYDIITTIAYPISVGYGFKQTIGYAISGILFTFIHQVSNIIIFSIVIPKYLQISS